MYYVMRASAPSLHRESTDSLIIIMTQHKIIILTLYSYVHSIEKDIQLYPHLQQANIIFESSIIHMHIHTPGVLSSTGKFVCYPFTH